MHLKNTVGWINYSEEVSKQALLLSRSIICAYDKNLLIGVIRLIGDGMYNIIVDLIVHPKYQKMGIGTKLLELMENKILTNSAEGQSVSVFLNSSKGYENFYKQNGYVVTPNYKYGPCMRKTLEVKKEVNTMTVIRKGEFKPDSTVDLAIDFSMCDSCENSCYDCGSADCSDHCSNDNW